MIRLLNDELYLIGNYGISIMQWVYAVKYLRLALNFPLLIGLVPHDQIAKKQSRVKCTIWALNIVFYSVMLGLILVQVFVTKKVDAEPALLNVFVSVCLIVAIRRLKVLIRENTRAEGSSRREKLMTAHTVLFSVYIAAMVSERVTDAIAQKALR